MYNVRRTREDCDSRGTDIEGLLYLRGCTYGIKSMGKLASIDRSFWSEDFGLDRCTQER